MDVYRRLQEEAEKRNLRPDGNGVVGERVVASKKRRMGGKKKRGWLESITAITTDAATWV